MKKTVIFVLCLLGTAITTSAQFKIHSNGNLSFKRTATPLPKAPVSLGGNVGDSTYFITYGGERNGMFVRTSNDSGYYGTGTRYGGYFNNQNNSGETIVGLKGEAWYSLANSPSGNPGSIGVWGLGYSMSGRYSYGILGQATGNEYNVGVCGLASGNSFTVPDDYYAGLFIGKTKVVGTLTATGGLYNTTLYNCPVGQGRCEATPIDNEGMTACLLQGLTAFAYHNPQEASDDRPRPTFLDPDPETIAEMEKLGMDITKLNVVDEDVIERQIQDKQHYALSADELEKAFPDLVYTDKNGGKAINYVEMVPLLVQCINELNARLSALDGLGVGSVPARDDMAAARASRSDVSALDGTPSKAKAVLYQNTPNPFTAQTEIRFSLPENAPQAYIYIFDMTGKMQKQIPVDPSQQSVTINGYELSAGIYLYSLVVGGQEIDTRRMILSK